MLVFHGGGSAGRDSIRSVLGSPRCPLCPLKVCTYHSHTAGTGSVHCGQLYPGQRAGLGMSRAVGENLGFPDPPDMGTPAPRLGCRTWASTACCPCWCGRCLLQPRLGPPGPGDRAQQGRYTQALAVHVRSSVVAEAEWQAEMWRGLHIARAELQCDPLVLSLCLCVAP